MKVKLWCTFFHTFPQSRVDNRESLILQCTAGCTDHCTVDCCKAPYNGLCTTVYNALLIAMHEWWACQTPPELQGQNRRLNHSRKQEGQVKWPFCGMSYISGSKSCGSRAEVIATLRHFSVEFLNTHLRLCYGLPDCNYLQANCSIGLHNSSIITYNFCI